MTLTPCGHQGNCKLLLPWGSSPVADVCAARMLMLPGTFIFDASQEWLSYSGNQWLYETLQKSLVCGENFLISLTLPHKGDTWEWIVFRANSESTEQPLILCMCCCYRVKFQLGINYPFTCLNGIILSTSLSCRPSVSFDVLSFDVLSEACCGDMRSNVCKWCQNVPVLRLSDCGNLISLLSVCQIHSRICKISIITASAHCA